MDFAIEMPLTVGWGECDGLGIIYYPNYFDWFDQATWNFFEVLGLPLEAIATRYGIVGLPLMAAEAKFQTPVRYRAKLLIRTTILKMQNTVFELEHRVCQEDTLAALGKETRFWGVVHPKDPKQLKAEKIPPEFVEALQEKMAQHRALLAGSASF